MSTSSFRQRVRANSFAGLISRLRAQGTRATRESAENIARLARLAEKADALFALCVDPEDVVALLTVARTRPGALPEAEQAAKVEALALRAANPHRTPSDWIDFAQTCTPALVSAWCAHAETERTP